MIGFRERTFNERFTEGVVFYCLQNRVRSRDKGVVSTRVRSIRKVNCNAGPVECTLHYYLSMLEILNLVCSMD